MEYKVGVNYCNCHPETCCCNDWAIYNENDEKYSTFFRKEVALEICELLNNKERVNEQ